MAVALLALFVALGGTAVAAGVPALAKRALVADNAKKHGGQTAAAVAARPGPASTATALVTIRTATSTLAPSEGRDITVTCEAGAKAIAGGWADPGVSSNAYDSRPTADGSGWMTVFVVDSDAPGPQTGTVYAVCLR
jgi:hypothetical protein